MSNDVNSVTMSGRLGADPEVRYTQGGMAVATLRLANNQRRKVGGDWTDVTTWVRVKVFGKPAEWCGEHSKGEVVMVQGKLSTDEWTDREGAKRETTEVLADTVVWPQRGSGGSGGGGGQRHQPQQQGGWSRGGQAQRGGPPEDDPIPF